METHSRFIEEAGRNEPGHFRIEERNGMACLAVFPPGSNGRAVRLEDVIARIELFGLQDFDPDYVTEIVRSSDGQLHQICPWKEPEPVDGTIDLRIDDDWMRAEVEIHPPRHGGNPVTQSSLIAFLKENGIISGIDFESVDRGLKQVKNPAIIREKRDDGLTEIRYESGASSTFTAARGNPPAGGAHGKIQYQFEIYPWENPLRDNPDESGRVDFRDLKIIQTAKKGMLLAQIIPSAKGTSGADIRGNPVLPPDVHSAVLVEGRNTHLSGDGTAITAALDGQIRAEIRKNGMEATIHVEEVLNLENVDYSTGHIDFPGTVVIKGTVLDGFRVNARGDIIIEKSVGRVSLSATGNIILAGGIVSRDDGFISSGQSVYARFVETASVRAKENIIIEEAVMHSRLTAGKRIHIESGRGELIGGVTVCGKLVRAKKIGARAGSPTRVNAGLDPDQLESLSALENDYEERRTILRRVESHLSQIEESVRRGKNLEAEEKNTRGQLLELKEKVLETLRDMDKQRERIYSSIEPDPEALVEALEIVHPGVEVSLGATVRRYRVQRRAISGYCRFVLDEDVVALRHSDL